MEPILSVFLKARGVETDKATITVRRAETIVACILTSFDIYTDANTVYSLYTYPNEYLCSYNCPLVFAILLFTFMVYNIIIQTHYIWTRFHNILYTFLSLFGLAPVVIAVDMWNKIDDDRAYKRFFIMRWMETTNEALPAATIQIVILLFFSEDLGSIFSLNDGVFNQTIILILISIVLSLWSVGNGTRKYVKFVGRSSKPKWYYWTLALYTATDIFNRSLLIALFFVTILNVENYDFYVIVTSSLVIMHQAIFWIINHQRNTSSGLDDGCFGKIIKSNKCIFALFILFYTLMPSAVLFLRNFHVFDVDISKWLIWTNGTVLIVGALVFWILRVSVFNNELSNNYFAAAIYLISSNVIPFIFVLFGRTKLIKESEDDTNNEPELIKHITLTMADIAMSATEEKNEREEREKNRIKKLEELRLEDEKKRLQKEQEIKEKNEKIAQKMKEKEHEQNEERKRKETDRKQKEIERQKRLELEMEKSTKLSYKSSNNSMDMEKENEALKEEKEQKIKKKKKGKSKSLTPMTKNEKDEKVQTLKGNKTKKKNKKSQSLVPLSKKEKDKKLKSLQNDKKKRKKSDK